MKVQMRTEVYALYKDGSATEVQMLNGKTASYGGGAVLLVYPDGAVGSVDEEAFRLAGLKQVTEVRPGSLSGMYLLRSGLFGVRSDDGRVVVLCPDGGAEEIQISRQEYEKSYVEVPDAEPSSFEEGAKLAEQAVDIPLALEMIMLSVKARHGIRLAEIISRAELD